MPFFTSDLNLAEVTADPKPKQFYQPQAGFSPLQGASGSITGDPLSQLAQAMGGDNGQPLNPLLPNTPTGLGGMSAPGGMPLPPTAGGPQGTMLSNASGESSAFPDATNPYEEQYGEQADWYQAMDILNTSPEMQQFLESLPMGGLFSNLSQMNVGMNPFAEALNALGVGDYTEIFTDAYGGPGLGTVDAYDIMPGEQADMLIQQEGGMFSTPEEESAWYGDLDTNDSELESDFSDWSDSAGMSYDDDWGGSWDDDFGWD